MFGFLCPKGDEREVITEANCHKAVSPATATLFVYVCSTVRMLAGALTVEVACCRRWGHGARCLSRTLVPKASVDVRQTTSKELKIEENVAPSDRLITQIKYLIYNSLAKTSACCSSSEWL